MSPLDLRKVVVDAIQEILVPDLQEIKHRVSILEVEFKNFDTKFLAIDAKLTSFREEFKSEIRRLDEKIENQGIQWNQRIDSLEQKIENFREESHQRADSLERQIQTNREDYKLAVNLHERIAAIEAKLSSR